MRPLKLDIFESYLLHAGPIFFSLLYWRETHSAVFNCSPCLFGGMKIHEFRQNQFLSFLLITKFTFKFNSKTKKIKRLQILKSFKKVSNFNQKFHYKINHKINSSKFKKVQKKSWNFLIEKKVIENCLQTIFRHKINHKINATKSHGETKICPPKTRP